ncbi:MAG: STAS domain-containing protein [Candidatus Anammoximicrobium sp.]|nr:STAS domain-containing protein [Candidatus Anammoximicrobium sp.]
MTIREKHPGDQTTYRCPVCNHGLTHEPPMPRFDAPCSECGCHIWCRLRLSSGETVLEALPGRTPEPWDVDQVVESLIRRNAVTRVMMDLGRLDLVDSAFVARLLGMQKRIRASGGHLLLCGLCPVVREMFEHLRLDRAFEIVDQEETSAD